MSANHVSPEMAAVASKLLHGAGWGELISIDPLAGGRNNRVYRVTGESRSGILKQYHPITGWGRDRFASEMAWYEYCRTLKIDKVPTLHASDEASRCALLSEVSGRKLESGEATPGHVQQAAEFFMQLNSTRDQVPIQKLSEAADACLTIERYLTHVEERLQRLQSIPVTDDASYELQRWLERSLRPSWNATRSAIESDVGSDQLKQTRTPDEVCVSPSDFGFHNAILTPLGSLIFIDFEYAGRDDPAKMVGDFYWQVDIPAPRASIPIMLNAISQFGESACERTRQMFPVMGFKWCTIVLNDFINTDRIRREFALGTPQHESIRGRQLVIADRILSEIHRLRDEKPF